MYPYPEIFINLTIQAELVFIKQLQISKRISIKITFLAHNKFKIFHLKSYQIIRNLKNSKLKINTSKRCKSKVHMREEIKVILVSLTLWFLLLLWWIKLHKIFLHSLCLFLQLKRLQDSRRSVQAVMLMWLTTGLAWANKMCSSSQWIYL